VCRNGNGKEILMRKRIMMAGILAASLAMAQDEVSGGGMGGGRGGGRGGDMGGMDAPMARRATKWELFSDKLKLSREQKEEAQKVLAAAIERLSTAKVDADGRKAKIAGAIIDGKPADEVQKLTAEYTEASAQTMKIEADAFSKIWATLKPNQQQKADQAFELLAGIFSSLGRGRGGPGGGGMGRGRGGRQ
jgi:hypothetical protein